MSTESEAERARQRQALRRELRAGRRALTAQARRSAARRVAAHAQHRIHLHPGQRVALYAPLADELDIAPLAALARRHGARLYLPRITDRRACRMRFVEASGRMRPNRLGILEPAVVRALGARWLDVVFVPLVGFDARGMRLGMGAGYYDRALAFRRLRRHWRKPQLIGVGYALQRTRELEAAPHDVHLDAVITEEGVLECATGC